MAATGTAALAATSSAVSGRESGPSMSAAHFLWSGEWSRRKSRNKGLRPMRPVVVDTSRNMAQPSEGRSPESSLTTYAERVRIGARAGSPACWRRSACSHWASWPASCCSATR